MRVRENALMVSLLAALLGLAACVADPVATKDDDGDEEVSATEQHSCTPTPGVGCTLLRPVSWTVWGVTCLERPTTSVPLADGQTYTAIASPSSILGSGSSTLRCNGGCIETVSQLCRRSGPNPL